jgi:hypothetical protein
MLPADMPAIAANKPKDQSLIAALGAVRLPLELDSSEILGRDGSDPVAFRFVLREVPFSCTVERPEGQPVLTLTGDLGALPYTGEGAERRRAMQAVVAAARDRSGLDWQVTPQQQIQVRSGISLPSPLTHVAMILGAVTLLLRALPFLEQLLQTHEG